MPTQFETQLESSWPIEFWQDHRIVVAVSGGADSMALLRALAAIRSRLSQNDATVGESAKPDSSKPDAASGRLVVAHFNHCWRGEDSDADAHFVSEVATELGLPFELGTPPIVLNQETARDDGGKRSEETARGLRYSFLRDVAEKRGARYIVTAHTADDQAETVLHRILRGTGIGGLAGIPRLRALSPAVTLVRPMLHLGRDKVLNYLDEIRQAFRTDGSNHDTSYTRNRIRNELIPSLQTHYNPDITGALLRLAAQARDQQEFIAAQLNDFEHCILADRDNQVAIDVSALGKVPPVLVRELFVSIWKRKHWPRKSMGTHEWHSLYEIATRSASAKATLPGGVVCTRDAGTLTLSRL